ncbi:hypothetical protein ACFTWH_23505 [Streptomyces sp. NPDC057011]|uniref:hypothetical protein n=1 Tax=unclassified Streptomyces TaxID=2593676 RepID=UPI00363DC576
MNRRLYGLAANPALPPALLDRLVALAVAEAPEPASGPFDADADTGTGTGTGTEELVLALTGRADLGRALARVLAARNEATGVQLAYGGQLDPDDVDPAAWPVVAVALLDAGADRPDWARLLAAHPDPGVRWRLASCPGLPPEVAQALADDRDTGVVAELALWTTAEAVADRLARHPHAEVRYSAALNEAVSPAALAALITGEGLDPAVSCLVCDVKGVPFTHHPYCPDPDCELRPGAACDGTHGSTVAETRERAARNPSAPPAAAASLAGDPSMFVRWALAERSDLPQEVYGRLAEDAVPGVREAVAGNAAIGEALVRALAADPSHEVRRALAHHPGLPLDVLAGLARSTRIGPVLLPRIAAAGADELAGAAASPHAAVRMLAAQRRDLPPGVRDALAADPDAAVVASVAPHPGLPEERLRSMVAAHGGRVVARVAANPDAPGALLEELARREPPVRKVLRAIAAHPHATAEALRPCLADPKAGPLAAAHPALPPALLVELLDGGDEGLAEAAAGNPALPVAVMEELLARYPEPGVTRPVS